MKGNFHVRFGEGSGETRRLQSRKVRSTPTLRSGIFLVEAYRRIIRYNEKEHGELDALRLRTILRNQIAGIEVNEEAVRIAAFSLYLALLHYQKPRSIREQVKMANRKRPLPNIIFNSQAVLDDDLYFPVLYHANSFDLFQAEIQEVKDRLEQTEKAQDRKRLVELIDISSPLPLQRNSFDIVVGNPPWGYEKKPKNNSGNKPPEQLELEDMLFKAQRQVLLWCKVNDWSPGDRELSQAFIARSLSFLKSDGECGLLISAGVLLKSGTPTVKLRDRWLNETIIDKVVNFSHVRRLFFADAVSYFAYVQYRLGTPTFEHVFQYWSAKRDEVVENTRSVVLNNSDIHRVRQLELIESPYLWKTYWWGNHHDACLIQKLKRNETLGKLFEKNKWPEPRRGFKNVESNSQGKPSGRLREYRELPLSGMQRYGSVEKALKNSVPERVQDTGNLENYSGRRLLVLQGIMQRNNTNGRIVARMDGIPFCFQSSIYGFNITKAPEWQQKVLIGILWSSLARYYFFMTGSAWGAFGDKIYLHEVKGLPIRFPTDIKLRKRITDIVDRLREMEIEIEPSPKPQLPLFKNQTISGKSQQKPLSYWENELDNAVYDLYQLTEHEHALVFDLCQTELEFFYRTQKSAANARVNPLLWTTGKIGDLESEPSKRDGLQGYLYVFCKMWNEELVDLNCELQWHILPADNSNMLGVVFSIIKKNSTVRPVSISWNALLDKLESSDLVERVSQKVYVEGLIRTPVDSEIVVIKSNKRRLWTRSRAYEDAEATKVQVILMRERYHNQP